MQIRVFLLVKKMVVACTFIKSFRKYQAHLGLNEKHPPRCNYLGANTRLDLRLNPDDSLKENEEPINDLDKVAKIQDAYRNEGDAFDLALELPRYFWFFYFNYFIHYLI
jgi:hypothetical protein